MKKLLIIPLLLFFGCNVAKRQIAKMQVFAVRYPNDFKELANTLDPCFNGVVKPDTVVVKGKPDTVTTPGQTIVTYVKGKGDTIVKTITLPGKIIKQPVYYNIHDTVTDQRALNASNSVYKLKSDSLIVVVTQLKQTAHSRNIWMYFALGLGALILIFLAIKVYTLFSTGGLSKLI